LFSIDDLGKLSRNCPEQLPQKILHVSRTEPLKMIESLYSHIPLEILFKVI